MRTDLSGFEFMGFNATFNNISVILWWSFLLVEETGIPEENHRSEILLNPDRSVLMTSAIPYNYNYIPDILNGMNTCLPVSG
jgi:hypothetical protein